MKFSDLGYGAWFVRDGVRMMKIEEVEDFSKNRWNAVADGVLMSVPKRAVVQPDDSRGGSFLSPSQVDRLKVLAADVCMMYMMQDRPISFEWYLFFKENNATVSEACDRLAHVIATNGIGSKQYATAAKKCEMALLKAIQSEICFDIATANKMTGSISLQHIDAGATGYGWKVVRFPGGFISAEQERAKAIASVSISSKLMKVTTIDRGWPTPKEKPPTESSDEKMASRRDADMSNIHYYLGSVLSMMKNLDRIGWRSEEERQILAKMRPEMEKMFNAVLKIKSKYHQSNSLRHSFKTKRMTPSQTFICDILLREKLPGNCFFKYNLSEDPLRKEYVDFAIPDKKLAIFAEPKAWSKKQDARQDKMLKLYGWRVFRLSDFDCERMSEIHEEVERSLKRFVREGP